ncbi:unnamed protein product [marine sediment metagenome]|uniref:Ig-like domain-containing protein n=1 Tax=marine sediment metagenome TaxID=412755 RepID=X0S4F5_9ZZZZ
MGRQSRFKRGVVLNMAGAELFEGAASDPGGVTITSQPANWQGDVGDPAKFVVGATSGDASPLVYQWQELNGSWADMSDGGAVSGAETFDLTIDPTVLGDDQRQFRCNVSNDVNSKTTRTAVLEILGTDFTFFTLDGAAGTYISTPNTYP